MNLKEVAERLKSLKEEIEMEGLNTTEIVERIDDLKMELEDESPFTSFDDDNSLDNFSMNDFR